jgi:hypothetical protein
MKNFDIDIRRAIELSHLIKVATAELNEIKERVRARAQAQGLGPEKTKVELQTSFGPVSVTFVSDQLRVQKGYTPEKMMATLPSYLRKGLLEAKVVLTADAAEFYRTLGIEDLVLLEGMVQLEPQTSRVSFPKGF